MYIDDFNLAATVDFKFTTRANTGLPTTMAGSPAVSVYQTNSLTQTTTGVTLTVDFDGLTGLNHVRIDLSSDGTFYAAGRDFQVVVTAGTVGGTSVVGEVLATFSILNRSPLRPTTAGRTLDVSAGGEAGLDWANVGSPTTTLALTGTTLATTQHVIVDSGTVTTVTNQLTAAAIATGVWQDTTAGDFTVASSVGKSVFTGVAPGAAGGLFVAGTNAATTVTTSFTTTFTGNLTGSVGSLTTNNDKTGYSLTVAPPTSAAIATAVWTDTTAGDFTTALSIGKSVMNGVTLGTGLTVAAVSGAVGSVTGNVGGNVTGSVGSVVGAVGSVTGNVGGNVVGSVASVTAGVALTSSERNSTADALLKRDWTSVSGESSFSVLNALRMLRNVWDITGSTLTVNKEDGTTVAWTHTVSTTAGANPVTSVS